MSPLFFPQKWEDTTGKHPDTVWGAIGEQRCSKTRFLNNLSAVIKIRMLVVEKLIATNNLSIIQISSQKYISPGK